MSKPLPLRSGDLFDEPLALWLTLWPWLSLRVLALVLARLAGGEAGIGVSARLERDGPSSLSRSEDSLMRSALATEYDRLNLAVEGEVCSSGLRGVMLGLIGLPFTLVEFERLI